MKQAVKRAVPEYFYKHYVVWSLSRQIAQLEKKHLNGKPPADFVSQESMDHFYQDLEKVVVYLKGTNIKVILCSYPALISKENLNDYAEIFLDHRRFLIGLSLKGNLDCLNKGNEMIKKVAGNEGAGYVDLRSAIPQEAEFFGDNVHYTDKGAKIIANKLGQFIRIDNHS
jgi:hypothetical protein